MDRGGTRKLTGLTAESFDALAGELEARMSKSTFGGETDDPGLRAIAPD